MRLGMTIFQACYGIKLFTWLRRLFQGPKLPVATYNSLADLLAFTGKFTWMWDGDWGLSDPGYIQWMGTHDQEAIGDCDEYAAYTSTSIQKSLDAGLMAAEGITKVEVAEIGWVSDGKIEGHCFCILTFKDGTMGWMDYTQPVKGFTSYRDIATNVLSVYGGAVDIGIAMSVLDVNLNFERVLWLK